MLSNDQEVTVSGVKSLVAHVLAASKHQDTNARLHSRIASAGNQMQAADPVDFLIEIKGVPAQLVGNLTQRVDIAGEGSVIGGRINVLKGLVSSGGQNAVEPCLLVLVSRRGEGGAGELFGVQAKGWFLGRVLANGESALDGFGSEFLSDCETVHW